MENVLEIQNLRKEYEGFTLSDVSFSIPKGYIMGLIGPNGAGKTTIIKLILNLILRDAGEIQIFGRDNRADEISIKDRIGFVHDAPIFYDYLSLQKIASIIRPFYSRWDDEIFTRLSGEFELSLKKKFKDLSRGMKMKFALVLAFSHHADFIIMDEPTSGLDPVFRRELLERLSEMLQDEEKSILFSTHITSDLERIADYITFIKDGKIVFSTSKDEILDQWGVVRGGNDQLNPEVQSLLQGCRVGEFGFEGITSDAASARRLLNDRAVVERATLDDIMFFIVKGKDGDHGCP
ncbi:MAG TPA: ABC transporter ATP-binding protein [Thermoanaerobaculia bacterium]|nr:ABC transporter ATP-binding protein [Thermoanaerobaculia bacterium]HUM28543.1 ABC transporter ATP-binding protein [Thermoanaerobaculia bacterium]HXK66849.1 ABC transporter ATP-binding protein [Thermoanaerobaculia bacterium]